MSILLYDFDSFRECCIAQFATVLLYRKPTYARDKND
jgi:hypothetical protein